MTGSNKHGGQGLDACTVDAIRGSTYGQATAGSAPHCLVCDRRSKNNHDHSVSMLAMCDQAHTQGKGKGNG